MKELKTLTLGDEKFDSFPDQTARERFKNIPTKTSQISNDSGFITNVVADLMNYYLKSETYNRDEINALISSIPKFAIKVVENLPAENISETTIYLKPGGEGEDLYTEYIYANGAWEILGSQKIDLAGYATEVWVSEQLSEHNTTHDCHRDIREYISDLNYRVDQMEENSENATDSVRYTAQTLTEEQKAQARENIGAANADATGSGTTTDPDCHAEYFTITDDGVVSLKPEYRGATTYAADGYEASISDKGAGKEGSKNRSLPETLYIPNIVGGTAVVGIASGAFIDNYALKKVVLPSTVDSLPDRCFFNCYFLEEICNTENITTIGVRCLNYCSSLKMVKFPNLVEALAEGMGSFAFAGNPNLAYADIGNMKSIPARMFMYDQNLQKVRNRGIVTSVGDAAFFRAVRLRDVGDLSQLTTIGGTAFVGPDIKNVDWSNYTGSGVAAWSTPAKINPVDFWSACTYTPCENPLPTFMSNRNPAWATQNIGGSTVPYSTGCQLFTVLHAYCGLHNLKLNNPFEFEDIVNQHTPGALDSYSTWGSAGLELVAKAVGINLKKYTAFNQTTLQAVYDALADGKYVVVTVGNGGGDPEGHVVLVYGVKNDGKLMFADSDSMYYNNQTIPYVYSAFYQNFLVHNPSYGVFILS